jgi:hypothetical protein
MSRCNLHLPVRRRGESHSYCHDGEDLQEQANLLAPIAHEESMADQASDCSLSTFMNNAYAGQTVRYFIDVASAWAWQNTVTRRDIILVAEHY